MTRILVWTEAEISGLADATGLSRILTEVDDNGFVTRELGFDIEGKIIHRHPGTPTCANYGLFDLAKIAPSDRTEMDAIDFERLWSAQVRFPPIAVMAEIGPLRSLALIYQPDPMPYRPDQPYIPQSIGEIMDHLGFMMLKSPTFEDDSGYFPGQNIDTVFFSLNEGLKVFRKKLGEERYAALASLSERMRTHFEADPEDKTDDAIKGRELIHEMEDLLTRPANDIRQATKVSG